jgi:phage tail-like protein
MAGCLSPSLYIKEFEIGPKTIQGVSKSTARFLSETERKKRSIFLIDETGNDKARWDIRNAWPTKCDRPDFSAKENEVEIELINIVHEGFTRVK